MSEPEVAPERDEDMLTRAEASDFLARFHVMLRPSTLARLWSVGGDGPPCCLIRGRPRYARGDLRAWALAQRSRPRQRRRPISDKLPRSEDAS